MPRRRTILKAASTGLAGSTLLGGRVAADDGGGQPSAGHVCEDAVPTSSDHGFDYVGQAVAPNPTEIKVRDNYAYLSTNSSVSVVDVSNPRVPVLVERAPAPSPTPPIRNWRDLKVGTVDGTPVVTMSQDNGDPGGVVVYDASDPENLARGRLYATGAGTHNHFVDRNRDIAYLTVNDPFSDPRFVLLDISEGLADTEQVDVPITRENVSGDDPVLSIFKLADVNEPMARAGINPAHEAFVERRGTGRTARHVAHFCFWDAGLVSVDVTDPTDPFAVAHFNATEDADVAPRSSAEYNSRYLGMPGNTHYSRPTPDGDYLFVGAEAYPDPTGIAVPADHGDIKVFDLTAMDLESPLDTESPTYDPTGPAAVECIKPPEDPAFGALRTSHNFDFTDDGTRFYSAWYQAGVRAYDTSDPENIVELAAFVNPNGNAFWGAQALDGADTEVADDRRFALGSDRNGKGIAVVELVSEESGGSGTASPTAGDVRAARPDVSDIAPAEVAERLRATGPSSGNEL